MKGFWSRFISTILIVGVLSGYNVVLTSRAKDEEIAKLSARLEGSEVEDHLEAGTGDGMALTNGGYQDGSYEGSADGFGGKIEVTIIVENGKIKELEITSAEGEDSAYLEMAKDIIPKIMERQGADVDTISGATFSSTGIKEATKVALEKAVR